MIHLVILYSAACLDLLIVTILLIHILLRRNGSSETRLAWLAVLILIPFFGAVLYILVGSTSLTRRRWKAHCKSCLQIPTIERPDLSELAGMEPTTPMPYQRVFTLAENLFPSDALGGNDLQLLGNSQRMLDAFIADMAAARNHIHLLTYIYLTDGTGILVAEALKSAAARGVTCRVLVDSMGSRNFLRSSLRRELQAAGVQVVEALPARLLRILAARIDLRNHRKIIVIDNDIGYLGSQNIADPGFAPKARYAPWVDCMVRIEGPGVHDLQSLFLEDWAADGGEMDQTLLEHIPHVRDQGADIQIIGSGPDLDGMMLSMVVQACLNVSMEEIILTTPYFVPDVTTETSLVSAARRGVEVTIVVPQRNDSWLVSLASRSHYENLLRSGVHIYHFQPGLLHAKTLTIDRQLALVGSANLDRRSLELNFEVNMLAWNPDFAGQLRLLQKSYLNDSMLMPAEAWLAAPWTKRLARNAAGLLSPLL